MCIEEEGLEIEDDSEIIRHSEANYIFDPNTFELLHNSNLNLSEVKPLITSKDSAMVLSEHQSFRRATFQMRKCMYSHLKDCPPEINQLK